MKSCVFLFFLHILAKSDVNYNLTCWVHTAVSYRGGAKTCTCVHMHMHTHTIVQLHLGLNVNY